jgi:hypothetical protein
MTIGCQYLLDSKLGEAASVVVLLASDTQVRGFKTGRSHRIFKGR